MNRAIIVREKVGRLVSLLTAKTIAVTQRGSSAFVEYDAKGRPRVVNVPYIPDDASDEFLGAIEGFLDHEVAHVLFTDYTALAKAKKLGVGRLHNIIEDAFIERMMAERFAGSGLNLRNVGEFFLKGFTDKELKEHPENAVGILMVPAIRALSGQTIFKDYMEGKWHFLEPIMSKIGKYAADFLPNIKNSHDAVAAAAKFKELLDAPDEESEEPDPGKGEPGESGKGEKSDEGDPADDDPEDETMPGDDEEGESDVTAESDGEGDTGKGAVDGDAEEESAVDGDGIPSKEPTKEAAEKSPSFEDLDKEMDGKDYDEKMSELLTERSLKEGKESDYIVYTRDFDVIEPMGLPSYWDDSMLKSMQDKVDHMVGPLQKDLERAIAAKSAATWSAGHRSGRLHAGALARLTTFGDDRVFRRKHVSTTKDVAVSLVIDCSGSMSRDGKIDNAAYAAYGLSSVLDRLNIEHEVLGFTTRTHMPHEMRAEEVKLGVRYARSQGLFIPIFKSFSERLGTASKKRLAALTQANFLKENVDGESIQIAATRLLQRQEKRKILIVLSDGQPACPGDYEAQQRHLKKTVKDIERQGVDVLGIGIMSEAPKNYYPKYVLLNALADLPTTVIGEIKRLLMKG